MGNNKDIINQYRSIFQSRRSSRSLFPVTLVVVVLMFEHMAFSMEDKEVFLMEKRNTLAQMESVKHNDVRRQRMIDPETRRDVTGEYIAEKLIHLEKIAENIIQRAADEYLRHPDKKQEIYEKACQELHQKLGMGSIGPATAAAGPLMEKKKARLAEVLGISMDGKSTFTEAKFIPFEKEGKCGYRNEKGDIVIKNKYLMAGPFLSGGIAAVVDDQGWVYINRKGAIVLRPFVFDNGPDYFREGLARFTVRDKFGFFNESGDIIIPARFDFAFPFSEGLSAACMECQKKPRGEHTIVEGGRWGYIDKKGDWVIPPIFSFAGQFEEGKAQVKSKGRCMVINRRGEPLSECKERGETPPHPESIDREGKNMN